MSTYTVLKNDGHNHPDIYEFSSKKKFFEFMKDEEGFTIPNWEKYKEFEDDNSVRWSEWRWE